MTDRTQKADTSGKSESLWRTVAAIIGLVITIGSVLVFYTRSQLLPVETRVSAVETKIGFHTDNTSIHRTAEEAREFTEGQDARWNQLFRELDQLGKRIDNIERRAQ